VGQNGVAKTKFRWGEIENWVGRKKNGGANYFIFSPHLSKSASYATVCN